MKPLLPHAFRLVTLSVAVIALTVTARANAPRVPQVNLRVIAEQTDEGSLVNHPTPEAPAFYTAYDAGYIEAGDPIAGERPPTAAAIARALQSALATQGYEPAPSGSTSSLVLIYHWGSIRPVSHRAQNPFKIDPNLKARLALVGTINDAHGVENYLLSQKLSSDINRHFPTPAILTPSLRDVLDLARDGLYFVVVSAYDHDALGRGEKTLLWRVSLTARDVSGAMDTVLPALIAGSAPYLGQHFDEMISVKAPLVETGPRPATDETSPAFAFQPPTGGSTDANLIQSLMKKEHDAYSGEFGASLDDQPRMRKPAKASLARAKLPPALAQRIAVYSAEKAALQNSLAEKIKPLSPGDETRRAIDAFNSANAGRIVALNQTRESIRAELAQFSSANAATGDRSLDALLREFAADVRTLDKDPSAAVQ